MNNLREQKIEGAFDPMTWRSVNEFPFDMDVSITSKHFRRSERYVYSANKKQNSCHSDRIINPYKLENADNLVNEYHHIGKSVNKLPDDVTLFGQATFGNIAPTAKPCSSFVD